MFRKEDVGRLRDGEIEGESWLYRTGYCSSWSFLVTLLSNCVAATKSLASSFSSHQAACHLSFVNESITVCKRRAALFASFFCFFCK